METLFEGVHKPTNKLAIFYCGASGTGKTSSIQKFLDTAGITTTYVYLNIDDYRKQYPTSFEETFQNDLQKTIEGGYSFFLDSTCRAKKQTLDVLQKVKAKKYKIILGMLYADIGIVMKRVAKRTEQPIPEEVVRDVYQHMKKNAEVYMTADEIDELYLFNTNHTHKLILSKLNKKVKCIVPNSSFYFTISKYCDLKPSNIH